jgi:Cytochrome oxidase complex assembly protein 1
MSTQTAMPEAKPIPPEIDRWNWGAFLLNWIWGVGNNTFIALLMFIPLVNVIMPFVLGVKGSRWAWRNGRWDSVEHFKRIQRLWAIWGAVIWAGLILMLVGMFFGVSMVLQHSEAYQLGAARVQNNPIAANLLGTPISTGRPTGSVRTSGSSGEAILGFSASGPRGSGRILEQASRSNGVWTLTRLMLKLDGKEGMIDLLHPRGNPL